MAFDGGFLHTVTNELQQAVDCHVEKIYQPARDVLVLNLRKKGFANRLVLSAASGTARAHFTQQKYENPATPPMFCMLARKIFSSAKITSINQIGLERVIEIIFEATNEMGDKISPKIICEFITGSSNIILVGQDGKIYDAVHRSDIEKSDRMILSGANYKYPNSQNKINILNANLNAVATKILNHNTNDLPSAMLQTLQGVSPLVCREILGNLDGEAHTDLTFALQTLKQNILSGKFVMLCDSNNTPVDFCYMPIAQYGQFYTTKSFDSPSDLLDAFYFEREKAQQMHKSSADITKLLSNLKARANRRMAIRQKELAQNSNREDLRIKGELIKANLYAISSGSATATVQNYYDENLSSIQIPLDPSLTPQQNAAKYFKDYKKSCTAVASLGALIEADRQEIEYLDSVEESLSRAKTLADIAEIREELTLGGYIRKNNKKQNNKKSKPQFAEYQSVEGYRIIVGKNNLQNDYITGTLASKGDMWFHTKNIHGSHVVVLCGGQALSEQTIMFAAKLAAKNSKAATSSNVPVDYTPIKYVKKPNGAKAGKVIYTTNKTIFVTPEDNL